MPNLLKLTLLTLIHLSFAGCASQPSNDTSYRPVAESSVLITASQEQTSNVLLAKRKLAQLRREVEAANSRKAELDKHLIQTEYEINVLKGNAPSVHESNIENFQQANLSAQSTIAASQSKLLSEKATLNARLDVEMAEIDAKLQAQIAILKGRVAIQKARKKANTRIEIAQAEIINVDETAKVVAPVLTNNRVIAFSTPSTNSLKNTVGSKPTAQINPIVAIQKKRVVFDVMYTYTDKQSWKRFNKLLRGYGVKDMNPIHDIEKGRFYTYVGRYYTIQEAINRKLSLNRKTYTDHAEIKSSSVTL